MKPRLSDRISARLHVVAGGRRVALHDSTAGRVALVGEREWSVLRHADGTRDLDGLVEMASRQSVRLSRGDAARWFDELIEVGLVEDPSRGPATPASCDEESVLAPSRTIRHLPRYGFRCDGAGSCCRIYPTTLFDEPDALRARALVPEVMEGASDASRVFTPARGSRGLTTDQAGAAFVGLAVAMVDGACAYLGDRGCRVHEAGGGSAKPMGCRLYPAHFVDDGTEVRVTVVPECACVFRSANDPEATGPLLEATTTDELPASAHIRRLAKDVLIDANVTWSRERYLAWHQRHEARIFRDAPTDAVRELLSLSSELAASHEAGASRPGSEQQELDVELGELASRAKRHLDLQQSWRAPTDLSLIVPRWIAAAVESPAIDSFGSTIARDEALYLRAVVFGHLWLDGDGSLAVELRRRAARVVVARRLVSAARDAAGQANASLLAHPLALVEAASRWL